jgi:hypothetical protein
MTSCLQALVNRVIELRQTGIRTCHCTEEFTDPQWTNKHLLPHIFEAFWHTSQAAAAGVAAIDDDKLLKRMCWPSLKKVLVPR